MADSPIPICGPPDLQQGAFNDLVSHFSVEALQQICVEASRACETEVGRRLMPFTVTESHRADGLDPDEMGGVMSGLPLDMYGTLGRSYAAALGSVGSLVRRIYLREWAPHYQEYWAYSNVTVTSTASIGGTINCQILRGPEPDSGLLWLRLGNFVPVGSLVEVTYTAGYQTFPADLVRAAKYMAAAICVRELDPTLGSSGHDAGNLESLASGWLSVYARHI